MQYAIVNFTTKQSDFYATFEDASNACTNYNVQKVYIKRLYLNVTFLQKKLG